MAIIMNLKILFAKKEVDGGADWPKAFNKEWYIKRNEIWFTKILCSFMAN